MLPANKSHHPYYNKINIPRPKVDVRKYWSELQKEHKFYVQVTDDMELWEKSISTKMRICGLYPDRLRLFWWTPRKVYNRWHIDGTSTDISEISMNWIISGSGFIQWSNTVVLDPPDDSYYNAAGAVESGSDDPYDAQCSGDGYLLNTAITHRVVNNSSDGRTTVTLSYNRANLHTFEDSLNRLQLVGLAE